jgi:hypothetical protein
MVGFEGVTGSSLIMGDDRATHDCYVQMAGGAKRIDAAAFSEILNQSSTLRPFLLRYVHAFHIQTTYTALLNARSKTDERLARWLLMCADRVVGPRLNITHEFLAVMLGVRRPGVTVGLQVLEGMGMIQSRRSEIVIRDREALIILAGTGYGEAEANYKRLVG